MAYQTTRLKPVVDVARFRSRGEAREWAGRLRLRGVAASATGSRVRVQRGDYEVAARYLRSHGFAPRIAPPPEVQGSRWVDWPVLAGTLLLSAGGAAAFFLLSGDAQLALLAAAVSVATFLLYSRTRVL